MKKRLICIFCCLTLLIGLACSVVAAEQDNIELKETFYGIGSGFDGIHSYNAPGHPGGVFLTTQAYNDSITYYDQTFPWLDAISLSLNDSFVSRSWTPYSVEFVGEGESDSYHPFENAVYFHFNMSMVSSPDYHIKLFFQHMPDYALQGFEVQTASQTGSSFSWSSAYIESVPFTLSLCSEVPDEIYAFPMSLRDGSTVYMNELFGQATYADNVFLLQFDSYNLDVAGFRLIFKNATNLSYSDYATMSGSWFQQFGTIIGGMPIVLADMIKYFFVTLPWLATMSVMAGIYIFISSISKWAGG